jgi:hypothetical protein
VGEMFFWGEGGREREGEGGRGGRGEEGGEGGSGARGEGRTCVRACARAV